MGKASVPVKTCNRQRASKERIPPAQAGEQRTIPPAGNGDITQTLLPLQPAKTGKGSTEAPARAGRQASTPQEGTTPQAPRARHEEHANSTQRTQPHAKRTGKGRSSSRLYKSTAACIATLGDAPPQT